MAHLANGVWFPVQNGTARSRSTSSASRSTSSASSSCRCRRRSLWYHSCGQTSRARSDLTAANETTLNLKPATTTIHYNDCTRTNVLNDTTVSLVHAMTSFDSRHWKGDAGQPTVAINNVQTAKWVSTKCFKQTADVFPTKCF